MKSHCKRGHPLSGDNLYVPKPGNETSKPRGLLCSTCNSGIGMFDDNPALLELAAEYLRKYGK